MRVTIRFTGDLRALAREFLRERPEHIAGTHFGENDGRRRAQMLFDDEALAAFVNWLTANRRCCGADAAQLLAALEPPPEVRPE